MHACIVSAGLLHVWDFKGNPDFALWAADFRKFTIEETARWLIRFSGIKPDD